jgi:glycosyltransferase involved in cell wall biosynthesis
MRVLIQQRSARSLAVSPGGDAVKAEETQRALQILGVQVDMSSELAPELDNVDVVNIFNLVRPQEGWHQMRNAKRHGLPVVLSTVYCDAWVVDSSARTGIVGRLAAMGNRDMVEAAKALGRGVARGELHRGVVPLLTRGYTRLQREIISQADVIAPDSVSELRRIEHDLELTIPDDRVVITPNGADSEYYSPTALGDVPVPSHLRVYEGAVICVGRIEARKNQLRLVRALADLPVPVVIVGKPAPNQRRYYDEVREAAGPGVHFVGYVSQEEKRWIYQLGAVHVLPSWFETTGLVTLEAALMGCAVVITPNGDTREYFDDYAHYCAPDSESSIREAVERALESGPSDPLQQRIRDRYTWRKSAEAMLSAYRLSRSPR